MKNNFSDFAKFTHSIKDLSMLEDFLIGVTTPRERAEMLRRVEIVKRLLNGEPHQQIAKSLKVGVATVTRGSKELAMGHFKVMRQK